LDSIAHSLHLHSDHAVRPGELLFSAGIDRNPFQNTKSIGEVVIACQRQNLTGFTWFLHLFYLELTTFRNVCATVEINEIYDPIKTRDHPIRLTPCTPRPFNP
jgi:hypothetical protein